MEREQTINAIAQPQGARGITDALQYPSRRSLVLELCLLAIALPFAWLGTQLLGESAPQLFQDAPPLWVSLILIAGLLVPLPFRRRFPLSVLVLVTSVFLVIRELSVPEISVTSISLIVVYFSAGRFGKPGWRDLLRGLGLVAIILLLAKAYVDLWPTRGLRMTDRQFWLSLVADLISSILLLVVAWWWGNSSRIRVDRERELAARTMELEASREENARRAVMDERVRIAREIHDVVAHHVSVMGVQAGAARRVVSSDPEKAAAPLHAIEQSSRQAVAELHRLLGFLRRADEPDPDGISGEALSPVPGLSRLPELRAQLANAGLALRLEITGEERALPPSVDLSGYRIIQEALTNTLKYSGRDVAEVNVDYRESSLHLYIGDRGRGPVAKPSDRLGGAGLQGMAERVALLGGQLHHGARPGGGFEVRADLPYAGVVTAAPTVELPQPEGVQ